MFITFFMHVFNLLFVYLFSLCFVFDYVGYLTFVPLIIQDIIHVIEFPFYRCLYK
jgi:hypothetical protein